MSQSRRTFLPPQRSEREMLVDIATAARAFLKSHGIVEDWENAYEEAEELETTLQEWEATILV